MTGSSAFAARQAALVSSAVVPVGDARVRVHSAGPESGRAIVLLPGLGRGALEDSALLLPMLARRHRVLAIDWIDARPPSVEAAGSAVLEIVGAGDRRPAPLLVGLGPGAAVAVSAAAQRPEAVSALVLVAGWVQPTARLRLFAALWRAVAVGDPAALPALARLVALDDVDSAADPLSADTEALLALAERADVTGAADALGHPALIVGCRSDAIVGLDGAHALVGALAGARYAEIESGHAVSAERPAELLALIEAFAADPERHPPGSVLPTESL